MADLLLRSGLLFDRKPHLQVSASLRYGPPATLDRARMADDLQLGVHRAVRVSASDDRSPRTATVHYSIGTAGAIAGSYRLVHVLLRKDIRASDEVHRAAKHRSEQTQRRFRFPIQSGFAIAPARAGSGCSITLSRTRRIQVAAPQICQSKFGSTLGWSMDSFLINPPPFIFVFRLNNF